MTSALEPVRLRLRREADDEAARIRSDAQARAAEITARAHQDAAAAVDEAIASGQSDATALAAEDLRRARDAARTAVLTAQREACDELRRRVRSGLEALPADPGYGLLAGQLTRLAVRAAGPDAVVTPAPAGGVVARAAGVVVDCSLDRLAELAVEALGPAIRELWLP